MLDRMKQCVSATYDFSTHAGAVGTVTLLTNALPADAVVTDIYCSELTNVTSGGSATLKLIGGSTDLSDATAIASFTGQKSLALASSATAIKVSAISDMKVEIATAAVTAGKVRFMVEYYVDQDTTNTI